MIVDAHFHLFKEFYQYQYVGLTKDIDRIVSRLFGKGKLEQAWVLAFPGIRQEAGNEDVLEVARRYPDLFVPFGYLDLRKSTGVVEQLKESGFVGLKSIFPPYPYGDERLFPFYEKAEALRMPILFHTGRCGIFPPYVLSDEFSLASQSTAYHNPRATSAIADEFPELRIIIGHSGCPWHLEAAEICKTHRNVYMDISAYPSEQDLRDILATGISASQVLFGSDFPVCHPLERLYRWEVVFTHFYRLGEDDQSKIFGGNALRILSELRS
ncbi:MAG: hypothetical protein FJ278_19620 [Planctomycetes bacterium]|nr:hypothetical protein [Planctomycetota bacterium]